MLGLIIGMYLFGYTSPMGNFIGQQTNLTGGGSIDTSISGEAVLNNLKDAILSPFGLTTIAMIAGFGLLGGLGGAGYASGSILTFALPILILFGVANIFFFPVVTYTEITFSPVSLLLSVVFNTLLLLTIIEYVSGRA